MFILSQTLEQAHSYITLMFNVKETFVQNIVHNMKLLQHKTRISMSSVSRWVIVNCCFSPIVNLGL